jgi:hypothetical protein
VQRDQQPQKHQRIARQQWRGLHRGLQLPSLQQ